MKDRNNNVYLHLNNKSKTYKDVHSDSKRNDSDLDAKPIEEINDEMDHDSKNDDSNLDSLINNEEASDEMEDFEPWNKGENKAWDEEKANLTLDGFAGSIADFDDRGDAFNQILENEELEVKRPGDELKNDKPEEIHEFESDESVLAIANQLPEHMGKYRLHSIKDGGVNSPGIHGGVYSLKYRLKNKPDEIKTVLVLFKQDTRGNVIRNQKNIAEAVASEIMNELIQDSVATVMYASSPDSPRTIGEKLIPDETGKNVYIGSIYFPTRNTMNEHYKDLYAKIYSIAGIPVPAKRPLAMATGHDRRFNREAWVKKWGPNELVRVKLIFRLHNALQVGKINTDELKKIMAADPHDYYQFHEVIKKYLTSENQTELSNLRKMCAIDFDKLYDLIGNDHAFDSIEFNAPEMRKEAIKAAIKNLGESGDSGRVKLLKLVYRHGFLADKQKRDQIRQHRSEESICRFKDFEKVTVASLFVGDFDVHTGNYGVVVDEKGEARLVKIDHGAALHNIELGKDGEIHMHSHSRHRLGKGPTNHFREFPRSLKISKPYANEIDEQVKKAKSLEFAKRIETAIDRAGNFYGARPMLAFIENIGKESAKKVRKYKKQLAVLDKRRNRGELSEELIQKEESAIHAVLLKIAQDRLKFCMAERTKALEKLSLEIKLSLCIKRSSKPREASFSILPDFEFTEENGYNINELIKQNPEYFEQNRFHFRGEDQSVKILSGLRWHYPYLGKLTELVKKQVTEVLHPEALQPMNVDKSSEKRAESKTLADGSDEQKRPPKLKEVSSIENSHLLLFSHHTSPLLPQDKERISYYSNSSRLISIPRNSTYQEIIARETQLSATPVVAKIESQSPSKPMTDGVTVDRFRLNEAEIKGAPALWVERIDKDSKKLVSEIIKADFIKELKEDEKQAEFIKGSSTYHFPCPEMVALAFRHVNGFIAARKDKPVSAPFSITKATEEQYVRAILFVCAARNARVPDDQQLNCHNNCEKFKEVKGPQSKEETNAFLDYFKNNPQLKKELADLTQRDDIRLTVK